MSTEHSHRETQKHEDSVQTSRGYIKKFISVAKTKLRQLISIQVLNKKKHHTPPPPPEAAAAAAAERDDQVAEMTVFAVVGTPAITEARPSAAAASGGAAPAAAVQRSGSLSTIVVMVREMELGKVLLTIGAGAIGFLIMNHEKLEKLVGLDCVLTGLVIGFGSIMVGLVIRKFKPVAANVIEQLGIVIMLVSFNGLVASALPAKFACVVIIFGGVYVSPFAIAIFVHAPADHVN